MTSIIGNREKTFAFFEEASRFILEVGSRYDLTPSAASVLMTPLIFGFISRSFTENQGGYLALVTEMLEMYTRPGFFSSEKFDPDEPV